ncbi:MAG: hypothetical protein ABI972_03380 [Acidobacteriota bacterium]
MRLMAILLAISVAGPAWAGGPGAGEAAAGEAGPGGAGAGERWAGGLVAGEAAAATVGASAALSPALIKRLRGAAPPERPVARSPPLWKASLVAVVVAAAADVATSYGKRELNPALQGGNGRFGGRGIAIKSLVTGSALAGQWFLVRKAPESGTYAAVANFGMAGVFTAAAVHNSGNRRAARAATLAQ